MQLVSSPPEKATTAISAHLHSMQTSTHFMQALGLTSVETRFVDCRPREAYLAGHIPGAAHADPETDLDR